MAKELWGKHKVCANKEGRYLIKQVNFSCYSCAHCCLDMPHIPMKFESLIYIYVEVVSSNPTMGHENIFSAFTGIVDLLYPSISVFIINLY